MTDGHHDGRDRRRCPPGAGVLGHHPPSENVSESRYERGCSPTRPDSVPENRRSLRRVPPWSVGAATMSTHTPVPETIEEFDFSLQSSLRLPFLTRPTCCSTSSTSGTARTLDAVHDQQVAADRLGRGTPARSLRNPHRSRRRSARCPAQHPSTGSGLNSGAHGDLTAPRVVHNIHREQAPLPAPHPPLPPPSFVWIFG